MLAGRIPFAEWHLSLSPPRIRLIGVGVPLFREGIVPSRTKSSRRAFNDDPTINVKLDVDSMFRYM